VKGDATEWRRVDNATSLIDLEVARIIDDVYSGMSAHVGVTLRPLTRIIHMYFVVGVYSLVGATRLCTVGTP